MGEFFILAKFQGKGIGCYVAQKIWEMHPGIWEVAVIPENKPAFAFWQKTIDFYTSGIYVCKTKTITWDSHQPLRVIFKLTSFSSSKKTGIAN